jgi:hypothetical protein
MVTQYSVVDGMDKQKNAWPSYILEAVLNLMEETQMPFQLQNENELYSGLSDIPG